MRLVCISDTHNRESALNGFMPEGDVLVHAGDLTIEGKDYEIERAGEWLRSLPYSHKIVIAGNHDFLFEKNLEKAKELLGDGKDGLVYLQNNAFNLMGRYNFYGMPQQPRFFDWAFNVDRGEAMRKYTSQIPKDTDVLITHGPPYGLMDEAWRVEYDVTSEKKIKFKSHEGCDDLLDRVIQVRPKVHVFGHFHSGYGYKYFNGTHFVNASICDEAYRPTRQPFVLEI